MIFILCILNTTFFIHYHFIYIYVFVFLFVFVVFNIKTQKKNYFTCKKKKIYLIFLLCALADFDCDTLDHSNSHGHFLFEDSVKGKTFFNVCLYSSVIINTGHILNEREVSILLYFSLI